VIVADNRKRLVGRILLMGAGVFALLAVLFWSGVMPVDNRTRGMIALAFGIVAVGDGLVGLILTTRSDS
jgi:hypothetical protein